MAGSRRKFATIYNEASDEQYVRDESSSGEESTGSVAAKYQIAAAHVRKHKEKGAKKWRQSSKRQLPTQFSKLKEMKNRCRG